MILQNNLLAVFFALLSALCIAVGTVLRHTSAPSPQSTPAPHPPVDTSSEPSSDTDGVSVHVTSTGHGDTGTWIQRSSARRSTRRENYKDKSLVQAMSQKKWWLGLLCAMAGYTFQVIALGFGSLLVVQPVLVLSLMFSLVLSAKVQKIKMPLSEVAWSVALGLSVAVLVLLGKPIQGEGFPPSWKWIVYCSFGILIVVMLTGYSKKLIPRDKALLLGVLTGLIFGYMALFSKAVVDIFVHYGIGELWHHWQLYALIFCSIVGTIFQQSSFNAGSLANSLPAMTVTEPLVAFGLGYAILGEKFQAEGITWLYLMVALVVMVVATVVLSRKGVGAE